MTRSGHAFTPEKTRAYERTTRMVAALLLPADWPLDAEYALTCRVFFPDKRRRDLDNVIKAIGDALNKTAYRDDSQVAELHGTRAVDRLHPRVEVELMTLGDTTT